MPLATGVSVTQISHQPSIAGERASWKDGKLSHPPMPATAALTSQDTKGIKLSFSAPTPTVFGKGDSHEGSV